MIRAFFFFVLAAAFAAPASGDPSQRVSPPLRHIRLVSFPQNSCAPWRDSTVCAGESIGVLLEGTFPSECWRIRSVQLFPSPVMTPFPVPPIVRVVLDNNGCILQLCVARPTPFHVRVTLPPLPPRDYALRIEEAVTSCSDSFPPESLRIATARFAVAAPESCRLVADCFGLGWGSLRLSGDCAAIVTPRRPASLDLSLISQHALRVLWGRIVLNPVGLEVANIEAIGAAAGMTILSRRTRDGAAFRLQAEGDAVLPGGPPSPILRVTLRQPKGRRVPARTTLELRDVGGLDAGGVPIDLCPISPCADRALPVVVCSRRVFELDPPWPNPTPDRVAVRLTLEEASEVVVDLYDVRGRRVATLANGLLSAGEHALSFEGGAEGPLRQGIYFLRARVDGETVTRRLVVLGAR